MASEDDLRRAAFAAVRAANELADEVDQIIDEALPPFASRSLRVHLRRIATRQRNLAQALASELDDATPDPQIVNLLTRAMRRAGTLFLTGALLAGGATATGAFESLGEDAKDSLLEKTEAVERACDETLALAEHTSGAQPGGTDEVSAPDIRTLIQALEAHDLDSANRDLYWVLELESLMRETLLASAQYAYGDAWPEKLNEFIGMRGGPGRRPADLSLRDIAMVAQGMKRDGLLPPEFSMEYRTGSIEGFISRFLELRNGVAHGRSFTDHWVDQFLISDGEDVLIDAAALRAALKPS